MKSNNPLLISENLRTTSTESYSNVMTLNGAILKTGVAAFLMIAAGLAGYLTTSSVSALVMPLCAIGSIICVFSTLWNKTIAPITVPIYSLAQGYALGKISAIYAAQYSGILLPAFGLTIGTLAGMLLLYKLQIIKVTEQFYSAVLAATFGVFVMGIVKSLMYFFGFTRSFENFGTAGLIIQLVIVGIAALNLVVDFDVIVKSSTRNLPKYMEWYSAMILLVTLVWLYIEILKLIAQFARRNSRVG